MPTIARVPLGRAPVAYRPARASRLLCRADSVLIANTKGGGHAFLGLHLARKLVADGHSVTILNDGEEVRKRQAGSARQKQIGARVGASRKDYHAISPCSRLAPARTRAKAGAWATEYPYGVVGRAALQALALPQGRDSECGER